MFHLSVDNETISYIKIPSPARYSSGSLWIVLYILLFVSILKTVLSENTIILDANRMW